MLKSLHHPNIIKLIEAYETPTAVLLVTELATGGELVRRAPPPCHPPPPREAPRLSACEWRAAQMHRVAQQGAGVLGGGGAAPHQDDPRGGRVHALRGVVHRDLKPENILLSDASADATIRIVDLGLGRFFGEGQALHYDLRHAQVPAPELVRCGRGEVSGYDQAVDIWGVGLLMYIMLFGVNPFDRADTIASNNAILAGRYTFPAASAVSIEAKDLISRILRTSPEQRPPPPSASVTSGSPPPPWTRDRRAHARDPTGARPVQCSPRERARAQVDRPPRPRHRPAPAPPAAARRRQRAPRRAAAARAGRRPRGVPAPSAADRSPRRRRSPRGSGSGSGASGSNGELTPRSAVALRGRNLVFGDSR